VALVDEAVMERNLARMAKLASDHRVNLRPHAKTHKSSEVARRQMAHGAVGLTAATMTEAETFAGADIDDPVAFDWQKVAIAPDAARPAFEPAWIELASNPIEVGDHGEVRRQPFG